MKPHSFLTVAAVAASLVLAPAARADVTVSVDIGPVGFLGGVSGPSEQDFYSPPAVDVSGETLGRVEVWFNGRGIRVGGVDIPGPLVPGFAFGNLIDFGLAPGDVNWVSDATVSLLDQDGQVIASLLTDDEVIGAGGSILDEVAVPFDAVVYGFAIDLKNPIVGPVEAGASVRIDLTGDLEIIEAAPIETVGVLTEESEFYNVQTKQLGGSGALSVAIVSAPAPLGSFTHAFSQLGDTEWSITWQAPQGQAFEIEIPFGFNGTNVEFQFFTSGSAFPFGFSVLDGDVQLDVDLLPGSPPLPPTGRLMSLSGPGGDACNARVQIENAPEGTLYQFSSVTISATVPSDYDVDLDSAILGFQIDGTASTPNVNPPPADPGQWVRLIDVPSPCPGDVDGDSDTDVFDFADLAANFGAGPGATREMGDLTGDGFVDVFDFGELAADFGCPTP